MRINEHYREILSIMIMKKLVEIVQILLHSVFSQEVMS